MGKTDDLIFLSYSRKDEKFVRKLYVDLRNDGFNIWFDQEEIVPGQKWQKTIHDVMSSVRAVLLCLSSNWIDKRGYVQKELKLALEILKEFPPGQVYIIPIRLDDCSIPASLASYQCLDVWNEERFPSLKETLTKVLGAGLRRVYGTERNILVIDDGNSFEELESDAPSTYRSFLTGWDSAAEEAIKLKFDSLNQSLDLLNNKDYAAVVELWKDVEGFEQFDLRHSTWDKTPALRVTLLLAKTHLLFSRIQLGQRSNRELHFPKVYGMIQEVIDFPPYENKGENAGERFGSDTMEVQVQNYRDLLLFIREWFDGWSPSALEIRYKIPHAESEKVLTRLEERLFEVEKLLNDA